MVKLDPEIADWNSNDKLMLRLASHLTSLSLAFAFAK